MLDWIRRVFRTAEDQERQEFLEAMDELNARRAGGEPIVVERVLGRLALPSGRIVLEDPQEIPSTEQNVFSGFDGSEAEISASLWRYPAGFESVIALRVRFDGGDGITTRRMVGQLPIDSAKVVIADHADLQRCWTQVGPDRIGKISTARNDTVKRLLTERFDLQIANEDGLTAEVAGPVSAELEAEIEAFLKTIPEYADYPFLYFSVRTNNSFQRINFLDAPWAFLPIGDQPMPLLFASGTGRGDGLYPIQGGFAGERLRELVIDFLAE